MLNKMTLRTSCVQAVYPLSEMPGTKNILAFLLISEYSGKSEHWQVGFIPSSLVN